MACLKGSSKSVDMKATGLKVSVNVNTLLSTIESLAFRGITFSNVVKEGIFRKCFRLSYQHPSRSGVRTADYAQIFPSHLSMVWALPFSNRQIKATCGFAGWILKDDQHTLYLYLYLRRHSPSSCWARITKGETWWHSWVVSTPFWF